MGTLQDKVAVVTGGGTGIGRAICLALASEGAHVVVVSNVRSEAEAVAKEVAALGREGTAFEVDVTDVDGVQALADSVEAKYGHCDIVVTSAGVMGARELFPDIEVAEWRKTMEVNLNGTFYCVKAFLPGMLERNSGRVITISSMSGKLPSGMNSDYAASKHAVIGLTKGLALDLGVLGKNGITANSLCPGNVQTAMMDGIASKMIRGSIQNRAQFDELAAAKNIQKRMIEPEEIAAMAVFLASDKARGITGQAISVDGGAVLW
jgi:NAD(P)-dependent dehydrogenase (short-subunit alcohol dehydrogenase family)